MASNGNTIRVRIADLKPAPYNPAIRVQDRIGLKVLAESMDALGQLYPIMVTGGKEIIDGHRRVAAAQYLGWDTVNAFIADVDQATAYGALGTTSRPFTGKEALVIYTAGGPLAGRSAKLIVSLEAVVGKSGLRKLGKQGFSASILTIARRVVRYCGRDTKNKQLVAKVVWWLADHSQVNIARAILDHPQLMGPTALWRKIEEDAVVELKKVAS